MTLADWLKTSEYQPTKLAAALGCRRSHIYRYLNGHRIPSRERIQRIHDLTDGLVSANDWYGLNGEVPPRPTITTPGGRTKPAPAKPAPVKPAPVKPRRTGGRPAGSRSAASGR